MSEVVNDALAYGVTIQPAEVSAGEWYWRIIRVHHLTPPENNGQLNLFCDVLDEQGRRINGARVKAWWGAGVNDGAVAKIDKPPTEPGCNFGLYSVRQVTSAAVIGEPVKSDVVTGVSSNHADEPPVTGWGHNGNSVGHHSFLVVWQKTQAAGSPPPVEPPPAAGTWSTVWTSPDGGFRVQVKD